ncbi:MAG: GNAT family N-acetyltransferase [Phycisphaerae bacterium]
MTLIGRFRLVRGGEEAALVRRGLFVLVGGPEVRPGVQMRGRAAENEMKVEGFLAYARSVGVDPERQVMALGRNGAGEEVIEGMCLWVPSPGRTAMLFGPGLSEHPEAAKGTEAAIGAVLADAREAGVVLVQSMMEPADAAGKTVFAAAGLSQLATLTYMERKPPVHAPAYTVPADVRILPYSAETHALFGEAIVRSYEQTLDCPALSGMREVEDIIAGHKGAGGHFDPQLWGLVVNGEGKALGCLLLGEIAARNCLETVYLGLVPEARGRGLGRVLMQRVLSIASRRGYEVTTLAVDAANAPAVGLYRRCGYVSVAQRVAMIRKLA